MNTFFQSVSQIFRRSFKAFLTFPASIGSALAFAVVTMIRIQLDWPQQEPFNFLFNCLHWSFAMGAIFSLAVITAAQSRFNQTKAFLIANLLGVAAVAAAFLGLYLLSGTEQSGSRYAVISTIAAVRVSAVMLVSLIAFILLAGDPKDRFNFASSFFMTHKAFFIAIIYGAVIMAGASGVARAVQALLYPEMSSKVYMYIGTLAGFLTFTIFVGYFPNFRKGEADEHREAAQKQPRFIEILFVYIMIPILLALTVVLLIWAGKTVLSGMHVSFVRLSIIAASYTIGGLWLHVMVTEYESGLAKLYRRVYPVSSLVMLVLEAWAIKNQLEYSGLKLTEYIFIMIWIIAAAGAVLLLLIKSKAHPVISILTGVLAVISVLPSVGYQSLPVTAQIYRLESLLVSHGMLNGEDLTPSSSEPEQADREAITDAVVYLANSKDVNLPVWFDKDLVQSDVFKTKLGFEQTRATSDTAYGDTSGGYIGTYLSLPPQAIHISGYSWAVYPQEKYTNGQGYVVINGDKGIYHIYWTTDSNTRIPSLKILLDNRVIIEQDMNNYFNAISEKYPPKVDGTYTADLDDMTLHLQSPEADVLLVFRSIEIMVDTSNDVINYGFDLDHLYMRENQ